MSGGEVAISSNDLLDEYYKVLHDAYDALRKMFRTCRITQDAIATRLSVDKGLISRRLNGKENLTLKTLSFMATAMECRLSVSFIPFDSIEDVEIRPLEPILFGAESANSFARLPVYRDAA